MGVFGNQMYSIIRAMSLLTTVLAPPILNHLLAGAPKDLLKSDEATHLLQVNEYCFGSLTQTEGV